MPIKQTCPSSCELKDKGCYAKLSYVGVVNSRLENYHLEKSTLELAKLEANSIKNAYDKVPENTYLRLHVSGDSKTITRNKAIS